MTRKDYELIAQCIRESHQFGLDDYEHVLDDLVDRLALKLKLDNPNFNQDKFEEACRG